MAGLHVTTTIGADTTIDDAALEAFKTSLRGELLRPGDPGYDDARKVWNGMIDKRPALIARCTGVADIIDAVNFARTNELLVSVRGGGHNITGNAVCDGGLMIDLSRMKSVRVDPVKRTARAEAGLTWGEYNRETQAFGLASTGGGRFHHGDCRPHPGWRPWLAHGQARPQLRQFALGRYCHSRWPVSHGQCE